MNQVIGKFSLSDKEKKMINAVTKSNKVTKVTRDYRSKYFANLLAAIYNSKNKWSEYGINDMKEEKPKKVEAENILSVECEDNTKKTYIYIMFFSAAPLENTIEVFQRKSEKWHFFYCNGNNKSEKFDTIYHINGEKFGKKDKPRSLLYKKETCKGKGYYLLSKRDLELFATKHNIEDPNDYSDLAKKILELLGGLL